MSFPPKSKKDSGTNEKYKVRGTSGCRLNSSRQFFLKTYYFSC